MERRRAREWPPASGRRSVLARPQPLVLYEPSPGIPAATAATVVRLDEFIEQGDRDGAFALALTEFAEFGPDDIAAYRESPLWTPRVAAAHTIPREVRAEETFVLDAGALAQVRVRVLYLFGGESPDWARQGAEAVRSAVPGTRIEVLEGHGHKATVTAPDLLVAAIERFVVGA